MLIKWDEINSVNVRELDEEHKVLVSIINRLDDLRDGHDTVGVTSLLKELKRYAAFHFAAEEKYFALYNYPAKAAHETQHAVYKEKIDQFEKRYAAGEVATVNEMLAFLRNWWLMHINHSDVQYSDFFNDHGLF